MADRTIKRFASVGAGATDTFDTAAMPAGKKIIVYKIGGFDLNLGSNLSSLFAVQWGSGGSFLELAVFALTGCTYEFDLKEQITGDGAKFFRLIRQNNSAAGKRIGLWMRAHDI